MPTTKYTPLASHDIKRGVRFIDLSDKRYGYLHVIRAVGYMKSRTIVWECICDCGQTTTVSNGNLRSGSTKSCGCQKGGHTRFKVKHGLARSPEGLKVLRAWRGALNRCTDPTDDAFHYYGGRGIKMCYGWRSSVNQFADDMGSPPTMKHELDRENNASGHYSCGKCAECVANGWPMNVRWATRKEQMRNFSLNRRITVNGVTKLLIEWEEISGFDGRTIHSRLKRGWTPEDAIYMPKGWQSYKNRIRQGESLSHLP